MKRWMPFMVLLAWSVAACSEQSAPSSSASTEVAIPEMSVTQVAESLTRGEVVAVDANNDRVRDEHGTIPGACLLPTEGYEIGAVLPAELGTKLVFYCANTHCRASDRAAAAAREAGYGQVSVLRAGIMGWKEAGQATSLATAASACGSEQG